MAEQNSSLPTEGYCRLKKVLEVIPVSKSTWYAGVKSGKFPAPVKLGPGLRASLYRVEDIRLLLKEIGNQ